ncbi:hypothetical protein BC828DRAFT_405578 [Blastocladiella britannica]|nr:hypothetical protein BC828DRAFT_405578 [Blastocladiella britannica]
MATTTKNMFTIVPSDAVPELGSGLPRRAAFLKDRPLTGDYENASSLWEVFEISCATYGDKDYLGHRPMVDGVAQPYVWESFSQVRTRIANVAYVYYFV